MTIVTASSVQVVWNPLGDLQQMFQYHFMQNALLGGSVVAIVAGPVGYFMVVRAQTFAGHALSHVGFAGATGALLFGFSPIIGLLVVGIGSSVGIGALEDRPGLGSRDSGVGTAAVLTFGLGLGVLFLQLYPGQSEDAYGLLFGNVLGIADSDLTTISLTGIAAVAILAFIARPLLFASLDPQAAAARGVPVRFVSVLFMVLVAFAVAEAVQVVGILLIFALLVVPAATAQMVTIRPWTALILSPLLGLAFTWIGISAAYFAPYSVAGFYVTTVAFGAYLVVRLMRVLAMAWPERLGLGIRG